MRNLPINDFQKTLNSLMQLLAFTGLAVLLAQLLNYYTTFEISENGTIPSYTQPILLFCIVGIVFAIFFVTRFLNGVHGVDDSSIASVFSTGYQQKLLVFLLLLCVFFLYLFFNDPAQFRDFSSEEKGLENTSAIFLFVASILFFISGIRLIRLKNHALYGYMSFFFAILCFWICMEEISWTQGVLEFQTPELFKNNGQNETNLHNYYTGYFELAYYFSTFFFFTVLPFFQESTPGFRFPKWISFYIPGRFLIYASAMISACQYIQWEENIYFGFSFFVTFFILGYYTFIKPVDGHKLLLPCLLLIYLVIQISFLIYGYRITRKPVFNEYKEFFIAFSLLIYAIEIFIKVKPLWKGRI